MNVKQLEPGENDSPLAVSDQIGALIDEGADVISISWGAPVSTKWSQRDIQRFYAAVAKAKSMGTTILVATGDAGSIDAQ